MRLDTTLASLTLLLLLCTPPALAQAPDAGVPPADGGTPQGVLTKPPALLRQVEAPYPPEALAQGLEGTVTLQVDISETGAVTDAVVTGPAGHGFDEAALAAVRQFQFDPAEVDGAPAPVRITYAYQFVLREQPQPAAAGADGGVAEAPVNLSGRVLERGTRKPLVGADVALPDLGLSETTDADGRFAFRGVPVGQHALVVVRANYERFQTQEAVLEGQETRATYYVQRRFFSAYETVVRSERERKEVTRTTIQVAEVQRVPGTQGDTLKVVQNLPGVARPAFNGGDIIIRGTGPQQSGVYLDGVRIPILYHFGGLTSVYNSDLLESLDYLPGNFPAAYGNAVGGIIDVKSRAARQDRFGGTASVSLIESNLVLEGPVTKDISVAVAGRRSYIDGVLALLPDIDALRVAPRYYDMQARVDWRINGRHSLHLLGLTSNDKLGLVIERPADANAEVQGNFDLRTAFSQLRLRHRYQGERLRVDTIAMLGGADLKVSVGSAFGFALDSGEQGLRTTVEYPLAPWVTLAGGLDILSQSATVSAELPGEQPREGEPQLPGVIQERTSVQAKRATQYYPATWAELRLQPVQGLLVIPGLRSNSYIYTDQEDNKRVFEPRLAARYALTDTWTVKGGAGLYHTFPSQGDPTVEFGNPDLGAERSLQYGLGAEWQPDPAWFASGEVFYNRLSRLIISSDRIVERNGEQVDEKLTNGGRGRVYGFELLVRRNLTDRLFGWLAYTLSRSERRDLRTGDTRVFDNDQTHVLTLIASYKLPRGWEVGARMRYATGNPTTPVLGGLREDLNDIYVPLYGATNSERLPAFHQLDVRIDKTWVYRRWNLDVFLDLTNAYNNAAVEGVAYSYDYRQRRYFKGLPILPVLGAKGSF